MAKQKIDPLFAAYAASAPRLDLLFYIEHADRHLAEYSARTLAIVDDMRALYATLTGPKPGSTASQKRIVWQTIDRFKSSIERWYGNAGAPVPIDVVAIINADRTQTFTPKTAAGRIWLMANDATATKTDAERAHALTDAMNGDGLNVKTTHYSAVPDYAAA